MSLLGIQLAPEDLIGVPQIRDGRSAERAAPDRQPTFATALTRTVSAAMDMAGGRRASLDADLEPTRPREGALSWFI